MKVIKSLFLDELWEEFESIKNSEKKLIQFHKKLASLKFLDPACGCGNFLVITYREIRLLEIEILRRLYDPDKPQFNISDMVWVDIDQFYGIEIEEWPARISEVAMWLMDHQMNIKVSEQFGDYYVRLPLKKTANIINDNALRLNWEGIIPKNELSYILGNPPFVGKHLQTAEQKKDMKNIFAGVSGSGVLDYVTAWYIKAAQFIQSTNIGVAFVSTNSITQGEQVSILWNELFSNYKIKINFAHRTFKWNNEARGKAAVHVVVIGFSILGKENKFLFEYDDIKGEPHVRKASNISPYLVEASDLVILKRKSPLSKVQKMQWGNKPVDGGNLILTDDEKEDLINKSPDSKKYIKRLISAKEYINDIKRWCIWLVGVNPDEINRIPEIRERVRKVKEVRESSVDPGANKLAKFPSTFRDKKNPSSFILIPSATSENRKYIPMGIFGKDDIAHNSCHIIPDGKFYTFGILSSEMHMAWVKHVCGRLESRFRYSNDIVYNNFPWPENPSKEKQKAVEDAAQLVLATRENYKDSSLAVLYNPVTMPPDLVKAHQQLDRAVDLCYRPQPFPNETKRIEFLFELYEKYTQPLMVNSKKDKKKKIRK